MQRLLLIGLIAFAGSHSAEAGLVSVFTTADVLADFAGTIDSQNSSANSDTLAASASGNNSFTTANLNYSFTSATDTFSATALIIEEKTISARPGGLHSGTAEYSFAFTIDESMDFTLAGDWGFDTVNATPDALNYLLQDSGGATISSGSTTSASGVSSAAFSDFGTLASGQYTFRIIGELYETINNAGTASAGWHLQQFTLTASSSGAPEPSSFTLLMLGILTAARRPRRRQSATP